MRDAVGNATRDAAGNGAGPRRRWLGALTRAQLLRTALAAVGAGMSLAGFRRVWAVRETVDGAAGASPVAPLPAPGGQEPAGPVRLRLLAVNDFHGGLEAQVISGRPVGGVAVLGAYLDRWEAEARAAGTHVLRLAAGDLIGASPPISGLLQDEPALEAMDLLGIRYSAVGNHEFDEGIGELRRLQSGGEHPATSATGAFPGVRLRYLAANVVDEATGRTVFPPCEVVEVGGVRVGIIGAVLQETPRIVTPSGVAGLRFLPETETVNRCAAELRAQGVRTIVVLLHQGGAGSASGGAISGEVTALVQAEDPEVDVVLSGHSHRVYWGTVAGKLVTQANASGTHFAVVDLTLDPASGDVTEKRAQIVTAFADAGPGTTPHAGLAALVERARERVGPVISRVVATAGGPITRSESSAGESALGNLIADAHRAAMDAHVGFTNAGGIRADLPAGELTYGHLYTAQPFGNDLVRMDFTGTQLLRLLEEQWGTSGSSILKCSGITYTWRRQAPRGQRVDPASVRIGGEPLDPAATYTVAANNFLAEGGDSASVFRDGANRVVGPVDLDALIACVSALPQPISARIEGRISVQ